MATRGDAGGDVGTLQPVQSGVVRFSETVRQRETCDVGEDEACRRGCELLETWASPTCSDI